MSGSEATTRLEDPGGDGIASSESSYAIVVSKKTLESPGWGKVVDALVQKHRGVVVSFDGGWDRWLEPLRALAPTYACFVAQPEELGLETLLTIQRQTRQLDEDPYTDVVWGIVTGASAEAALRVAGVRKPLVIRRGVSGDRMELGPFDEGIWFYEGNQALAEEKRRDGTVAPFDCTLDNAHQFVRLLNHYRPHYFQTSGHANETRWEIGFGCKRGILTARDGVLYGVNVAGKEKAVHSRNPKVYLAYRNCLVGLVQDRQSLALGWMGSAGVRQMAGYVAPTWNGIAGNGMRKWFFDNPGMYSFSEAFFLNQQVLIRGLSERARARGLTAQEYRNPSLRRVAAGLQGEGSEQIGRDELAGVWDRDALVFYGDPAWDARMQPLRPLPRWTITEEDGAYCIRVSVEQAGSVGKFLLLPRRVGKFEWMKGGECVKFSLDNLLQVEGMVEPGTTELVRFRALPP